MKKNSAARQKEVNEAVRILNTTTRWRGEGVDGAQVQENNIV